MTGRPSSASRYPVVVQLRSVHDLNQKVVTIGLEIDSLQTLRSPRGKEVPVLISCVILRLHYWTTYIWQLITIIDHQEEFEDVV